jgi:hypothetical protein
MNTLQILKLHLESPLLYIRDERPEPFACDPAKGEFLFYFEIDRAQYRSIDPDWDAYLGRLISGGVLFPGSHGEAGTDSLLELPRGQYLFAQGEDIRDREGYIQMAVEVQREGLWRDLVLDRGLYLRYVYEDGKIRTQVFRPLTEGRGS